MPAWALGIHDSKYSRLPEPAVYFTHFPRHIIATMDGENPELQEKLQELEHELEVSRNVPTFRDHSGVVLGDKLGGANDLIFFMLAC